MTIPALVAHFPSPTSPAYAARAILLGNQWPYCWSVGNVLFRPISTVSTLGYAFLAWRASRAAAAGEGRRVKDVAARGGDWRYFAAAAVLGVVTIVHSAVNMQPLNDRLVGLAGGVAGVVGEEGAVELAGRWARWNLMRVVAPVIGGGLALSRVVG